MLAALRLLRRHLPYSLGEAGKAVLGSSKGQFKVLQLPKAKSTFDEAAPSLLTTGFKNASVHFQPASNSFDAWVFNYCPPPSFTNSLRVCQANDISLPDTYFA